MLAYQVADECNNILGIIATCLLDQRDVQVTKKTAINPLMAVTGKPFLTVAHRPLGRLRLPMRMITKISKLLNNKDLVRLLLCDKRASGISVPISFVHTMPAYFSIDLGLAAKKS